MLLISWRALVVLVALAVSAASIPAGARAGSASLRVDRSCHKVGAVATKEIASGLKRGRHFSGSLYAVRTGIPPVSQSFGKSFWFMAGRISGKGVGVWATTLAPALARKPKTANTVDAANAVAWSNSDWGSFGSFPKNYGSPPGDPPLDNPALGIALACVR